LFYVGGLRKGLMIIDVLGIICTIIEICTNEMWVIIPGRFLCGIVAGLNTALVPLYIREFSPIEI
jgi:membrane protein implicated in regulation of membrane protease activity